jgi:hypothetical protein
MDPANLGALEQVLLNYCRRSHNCNPTVRVRSSPFLENTHVSCRHELETPFESIYSTFARFLCSSTFGVELLQYGLPSAEEPKNDNVAHQQVRAAQKTIW